MAKQPYWSLDRVKDLVREEKLFVQKTRALDGFQTKEEAYAAIASVLLGLDQRDFAHTVELVWDKADVYGVTYEEAGWYLKLCIDEEEPEVAVISFHPLEHSLKTQGGWVKP